MNVFLTRMLEILSGEIVVSRQNWYYVSVAWSMYYVDLHNQVCGAPIVISLFSFLGGGGCVN
jgi:hypothetical protein